MLKCWAIAIIRETLTKKKIIQIYKINNDNFKKIFHFEDLGPNTVKKIRRTNFEFLNFFAES